MDKNYEIKRMTLEDGDNTLSKVVDLQNTVYEGKHHFTVNSFRKWYVENPVGKVVSFNAFYKDIIASHYAVIPYQMNIKGHISKGLLSMATVTHPEHRGKGLFKELAKITFQYAAENGYEFVLGVANENSFPGFMKHFDFKDLGQLNVKIGIGTNLYENINRYSVLPYWTKDALEWRIGNKKYWRKKKLLFGDIGVPFFKLIMGCFDENIIPSNVLNSKNKSFSNPFNLYIGLGADTKKGLYIPVPKFIKRSPFHLIFLDLTKGKLPSFEREDVFFQLIDFDVA